MNNKEDITKLTQRIFQLIKSLPEENDVNFYTDIIDENEFLKDDNEYLEERLEHFKSKYVNATEKNNKIIRYSREMFNKKDKLVNENSKLKLTNSNLFDNIKTKENEEKALLQMIQKYKGKITTLSLTIVNLTNENKQLKVKLLSSDEKLKTEMSKNVELKQHGGENNNIIVELNSKISELEKENDNVKQEFNNTLDTLNNVKIELETKTTENIQLKEHKQQIFNENEKTKNELENIKLQNIELEIKYNKLQKEFDVYKETKNLSKNSNSAEETDTICSSEYDNVSDETDSEYLSSDTDEKPKKQVYRGNKNTRELTGQFFDDIYNENIKRNANPEQIKEKQKIDYSYSTDYLCNLLHNSDKLISKEKRQLSKINENDEVVNENIFKRNVEIEALKEELKEELDEAREELKLSIKEKQQKNINIVNETKPNNIVGGGSKQGKLFQLYDNDDMLKLCIKNSLTTLTDQNIDKTNIGDIKRAYYRKLKRKQRLNKNSK